MTIKHLVVSGASYHGIQLLGALFEAQNNLFKLNDLKTAYGTSAGAIVLAIVLLGVEPEIVYDFVINRPWEKTYTLGNNIISDLITKKGVCDIHIISEILIPLLKSKLLDADITLQQFYDKTNIDFHIIATEVNTLHPLDFSHTTHPDLSLIDAVYMSSSIPFIFQPKYFNGSFVVDGGLSLHFPIKPCLDNGAKRNNILGFNVVKQTPFTSDENTPIIEYTVQILNNIFRRLYELSYIEIPNVITIKLTASLDDFPQVISDTEVRKKLWNSGKSHIKDLQGSVKEFV